MKQEVPTIERLGGGYDYEVWIDHLGIPTIQMSFDYLEIGNYHSSYDDLYSEFASRCHHQRAAALLGAARLGCHSPFWQLITSAAPKLPARRATMPGYIGLLKYTQQGLADIENGPERINQSKALAQKMGIRPIGTWVTLGPYDLVIIGEAPDDQTIAAFTLALARAGNVTSTTMRALSEEEFAQVVARLP